MVVSFVGNFTLQKKPILKACYDEMLKAPDLKSIVLNFQGVSSIDAEGIRPMAQFQQLVRENYKLYLCSLSPSVEKSLTDAGVLRKFEVFPDLMKALQAIVNGT